jgi:hypothetical protein
MLQAFGAPSTPRRTLIDRVWDALSANACTKVWVRGAGIHALLGFESEEPFARVTALGGGSYGLAFRGGLGGKWEPLLVDDLPAVVEHALIGGNHI